MTTERTHTYLELTPPRYLARPGAEVYHELHSGRTPICGMSLSFGYRVTATPAGRLCAACQKRRRAWARAAKRLEARG